MNQQRPKRPAPLRSAAKAFLADDSGVVMLEFILIAPLLSYLILAVLFFRNHIDYAMDSVVRARHSEWMNVIPGRATSATGSNSDVSGIFTASAWGYPPTTPIRESIIIAGLAGADGSAGGVIAAERYFNLFGSGSQGTPYDALGLRRGNYVDAYISPAEMKEEPWGDILGNMGKFFGSKVGGGTYMRPDGLRVVGWTDRFPEIVDPWMNQYGENLDPASNALMRILMTELNVMTAGRIPTPRVDTRKNTDIGRSNISGGWIFQDQSESRLQLTQITGTNRVKTIIQ
jgi:Flp pilus assembly pilin Flp